MDHGQAQVGDDAVLSAVRGISHIATLPEVTVRIIDLVEDPGSSARDMHHLISSDPALTARMLKVVNSAFYGLPRQIASINRAVSLLGLNAVKNIAIAASLAKLFRGGSLGSHFDAQRLWTHSCVTASAAGAVARLSGRTGIADEAFLAGLVHDVGILVELQHDRDRLALAIQEASEGSDFREAEMRNLGASHERFGAVLCEHWKFPSSLVWVVGHHHDPMAVPVANRDLPGIVHVADHLAGEVAGGFTLDLDGQGPRPEVLEALQLDAAALADLREQLRSTMEHGDELMAAA